MPGISTEQVLDQGIRQKSIHSFHSIHSFTDGSAFCPGAPKRVSLGLRETLACIHVIQRLSQPRVACWHGFRQNSQKRNACLHAVRQAVEKKIACIHGLRSEGVKAKIRKCLVSGHRAAKQRKLLTRNICLADFFGYQPNLHVKLMYWSVSKSVRWYVHDQKPEMINYTVSIGKCGYS